MRVSVWSDRGVRCRQEEFQSSPIRTYPASLPQHTDGQRWFQPRQTDEEIWQTKDQAPPRYSELTSECFLSLAERQSSATANILCRFQSVQCARAVCVLLKEKTPKQEPNSLHSPYLEIVVQILTCLSFSRNFQHSLKYQETSFITSFLRLPRSLMDSGSRSSCRLFLLPYTTRMPPPDAATHTNTHAPFLLAHWCWVECMLLATKWPPRIDRYAAVRE